MQLDKCSRGAVKEGVYLTGRLQEQSGDERERGRVGGWEREGERGRGREGERGREREREREGGRDQRGGRREEEET
eukprot:503233-Hanusia_phi.AAC.1